MEDNSHIIMANRSFLASTSMPNSFHTSLAYVLRNLYGVNTYEHTRHKFFRNRFHNFHDFNLSFSVFSSYVPAFAVPFGRNTYSNGHGYLNRTHPHFIADRKWSDEGIEKNMDSGIYHEKDSTVSLFWGLIHPFTNANYESIVFYEKFFEDKELRKVSLIDIDTPLANRVSDVIAPDRYSLRRQYVNPTVKNVVHMLFTGKNPRTSAPVGITNKFSKKLVFTYHSLNFGGVPMLLGAFKKPQVINEDFNLNELTKTWDDRNKEYVYKDLFKIFVNSELFEIKELATIARAIKKEYIDYFIKEGIEVIYTTSENINKNAYGKPPVPKISSTELRNIVKEVFPNRMLDSLREFNKENKEKVSESVDISEVFEVPTISIEGDNLVRTYPVATREAFLSNSILSSASESWIDDSVLAASSGIVPRMNSVFQDTVFFSDQELGTILRSTPTVFPTLNQIVYDELTIIDDLE